MQHHTFSFLTVKHSKAKGVFRGYASTHDVDLSCDQIQKGAFQKTLQHWKQNKGRFPTLYLEHDPALPIGICTSLYEDEKGLVVEGKLLFDFPEAQEAFKQLHLGKKGLSIGFHTVKSRTEKGVRKILELALEEISFVTHPCNPHATVHEYKALDHDDLRLCEKIQQLSRFLRHP